MSARRRKLAALANDPRTPEHERAAARRRLDELDARGGQRERRKGRAAAVLAPEALAFVPAGFVPHGARHPFQSAGSITIPRKLAAHRR